jgi:Fe-S-cluster containining protein
MKLYNLNKTKLGRFINSIINHRVKYRVGDCQPDQCETLDGIKGAACCKLGYTCPALTKNCDCAIYTIRFRNCRVFPANEADLKLVKNCTYKFI